MEELYEYIIKFFKALQKDKSSFTAGSGSFYDLSNYNRNILAFYSTGGDVASIQLVDGNKVPSFYDDSLTRAIRGDFQTYFNAYYKVTNGYNVGVTAAEYGLEYLLREHPLFQRVLTSIEIVPASFIPTAAVGYDKGIDKVKYLYNPSFYLSTLCLDIFAKYGTDIYSIDEDVVSRSIYHTISFVVAHEFMHIINGHIREDSGLPMNRTSNIVNDFEINSQLDKFLNSYSPVLKIEGVADGFTFEFPSKPKEFIEALKDLNTELYEDLKTLVKLTEKRRFTITSVYFSFKHYLAGKTTIEKYDFLKKYSDIYEEIEGKALKLQGRLPDTQEEEKKTPLYKVGDIITCDSSKTFGGEIVEVASKVTINGVQKDVSKLSASEYYRVTYKIDYKYPKGATCKVLGSDIANKGFILDHTPLKQYSKYMFCLGGLLFLTVKSVDTDGSVEGLVLVKGEIKKVKVSHYQIAPYDDSIFELRDTVSVEGVGIGKIESLDLDNGYIDVKMSDDTVNTTSVFDAEIIKKHISQKYKIGDVLYDTKNDCSVKVVGLPTFDDPTYKVEPLSSEELIANGYTK